MTDVTEEPRRGRQGRALAALGALLGIGLVGLIVSLANSGSAALVTTVMAGTALGCPMLMRLPPWRPAGVGLLLGMAGAYLAIFTLFVLWMAGIGPG